MLVVPSASVADAVMCADVPATAFSATSLALESESAGASTSNSSTSVMVTVNVVSEVEPSALVAVTATVHDVEVS